jgi:hypothetical protein
MRAFYVAAGHLEKRAPIASGNFLGPVAVAAWRATRAVLAVGAGAS